MTAARSLVPLSRDGLLPQTLARINERFGTPHNALILTAGVIIPSLLLKLEILVEAASVVLVLTNILSCLSVIILRESRLQNYQPKFRTPLYPWLQVGGIAGFVFLIFEMGVEALLITVLLILGGLFVYWFYGRIRATREYALLHLIERITAKELTTHSLESELRDIIRERDDIIKDRFDNIIEDSIVLDVVKSMPLEDFFRQIADAMSPRLKMESADIFKMLVEREQQSSTVLNPFLAIPHIVVDAEHKFDILLARCREGIHFSGKDPKVHAVFVIMGSKDERNFHLHALAAIAQIVRDPNFEAKWAGVKGKEGLRDIVLLGERRRLVAEQPSPLFG